METGGKECHMSTLSRSILNTCLTAGQPLFEVIDRLTREKPDFILCYHDVGESEWEFSISEKSFEEQIEYLRTKCDVVSLDTLLSSPRKSGRQRVAVTFDDGLEGVYRAALPILKRYGLSAAVFAVNDPSFVPRGSNSRTMTVGQLQELSRLGWTIGFHTDTHADLSTDDPDLLEREIEIGKKNAEKNLSRVTYFAYPYGKYSRAAIDSVQRAGFTAAFTVNGRAYDGAAGYEIGRITVSHDMPLSAFKSLTTRPGIELNALFTKAWSLWDTHKRGQSE